MSYPLEPAGVDGYAVKVGSMLLTLVDPHRGYEVAYNRWYERDHFYAGCMIGPFLFAGSRWVATRALKDARWPRDDDTVASPPDAGSYVAIYWVERGHHADHFDVWARHQVRTLYAEGRGFSERRHIHTVLFDYLGSEYRDADPVPVELALDHGYDGLVIVWLDARRARRIRAPRTVARAAPARARRRLADRDRELVDAVGGGERPARRADGSRLEGGRRRASVPVALRGRRRTHRARRRTALHRRNRGEDLATVHLVAPFFRTVVGTDRYVDELW